MAKLKINAIADDKPVKVTIELPASVFRDLAAYVEVFQRETRQAIEISKLIPPMLERFMASDREFHKKRRVSNGQLLAPGEGTSEGKPG